MDADVEQILTAAGVAGNFYGQAMVAMSLYVTAVSGYLLVFTHHWGLNWTTNQPGMGDYQTVTLYPKSSTTWFLPLPKEAALVFELFLPESSCHQVFGLSKYAPVVGS